MFVYSHITHLCHLSDTFPIQNCLNQDIILQLLFHFAVKYAIKKVTTNNEGLKLKGVHHLMIFADDVNLLGENIHRGEGGTLEQGALRTNYVSAFTSKNMSLLLYFETGTPAQQLTSTFRPI